MPKKQQRSTPTVVNKAYAQEESHANEALSELSACPFP